MEESQDEKIKALQSKIAVLKADRDELYEKLATSKQAIQSLHSDIGHIMEFIISKRKDLSFIGPEFSSVLRADDEAKIHEIEFEYPEIHRIVYKDYQKASESISGINKRRLRGVDLFKDVNKELIQSIYPKIEDKVMEEFLDIMWNQMTFYEKKNWMEKRVVYSTPMEPASEDTKQRQAEQKSPNEEASQRGKRKEKKKANEEMEVENEEEEEENENENELEAKNGQEEENAHGNEDKHEEEEEEEEEEENEPENENENENEEEEEGNEEEEEENESGN